MSDEPLLQDVQGSVATLTLNRPDALNALNAPLRRELLAAVKSAARDEAVRAVVITGAGRGFCAGADLRGGSGERDFRRVLAAEYNPLIEEIRACPKPVVASVNGVAAGAGMSLALAADLVIAAEEARFVPAFHRIGLVPDSGLAATVVPAPDLADETARLAARLAAGATRGLELTKRLLARAEDATLAETLETEAALQEMAGRTEDHAEGVAAFAEKRDPSFRGR
jgi:2-(1,2-epoxy-1,2-dihydrophenyl)acetyl-CoA isomerase